MIDQPELGKLIRKKREAKGLGLRELARYLSIRHSHLSKIEEGKVLPRVGLLYHVATQLSLDAQTFDEIFSNDISQEIITKLPACVVALALRESGFKV